MPLKNRTHRVTYMPSKLDKYGSKFWMVVDNATKYVYNILPYLGAHERETRDGRTLAEDVVLRLTEGLTEKEYNLTTDNFLQVCAWQAHSGNGAQPLLVSYDLITLGYWKSWKKNRWHNMTVYSIGTCWNLNLLCITKVKSVNQLAYYLLYIECLP